MKLIVLKNSAPLNEVSVETSGLGETYEIYVGRSEDCHVQIDDPLISRHHFVLRNDGGKWICEKLTQLGVITINGQLISMVPVMSGDEIKCGIYSVIVSDLTDLSPQTTAAPASFEKEEITGSVIESVDEEPLVEEPAEAPALEKEDVLEDAFMESEDGSTELEDSNESSEMLSSNEEEVGPGEENTEFDSAMDSNFADSLTEEEGFGMESTDSLDDHESTRVFRAFVNYQLVLFGEHAPYDRYQIDVDEIFIGRDAKKCQIVLDDPEVSSVHAVLRKNNNDIVLEDLNSSNGTILNAERINKAHLTPGDEFVIGSTSFTLEVKSDLLETESDRLMPVESGQVIETEEVHEEEVSMDEAGDINFTSDAPQEKSILKRVWKDPKKRRYVLFAAVGLAMYLVLFYEEGPSDSGENKAAVAKEQTVNPNEKVKPKLSTELENRRNIAYELGVNFFEQNKYFEALQQFQVVSEIDPEYKNVQSYLEQTKVGLKRLEELEAQKRAEEDRIKIKKLVEELLVKAREAVKERQVQLAENIFGQIAEKDPENIEVQQLKLELESWQKEEERKALERASKEAARKKMVDALTPGKTFYLKKEWYRAILKIEEFLRIKGTDEDLVKEASEMLSDAKNQLASELGPLLGKARSFKEGQDLRNAYEAFLEVLKIEPTNSEALNEVDDIKSQLDSRSKRIYREAIIAESLSLFNDAKEKFQEVQQISPTDSEYYKKASEKLKNYLE